MGGGLRLWVCGFPCTSHWGREPLVPESRPPGALAGEISSQLREREAQPLSGTHAGEGETGELSGLQGPPSQPLPLRRGLGCGPGEGPGDSGDTRKVRDPCLASRNVVWVVCCAFPGSPSPCRSGQDLTPRQAHVPLGRWKRSSEGCPGQRWGEVDAEGGACGHRALPTRRVLRPDSSPAATSTLVANSQRGSEEAGLSTERRGCPGPAAPQLPPGAPSPPCLHFPSSPWISPSLAPCTGCAGP